MRTITSRFVLMVGTAAVAPLVIYGIVSFTTLRAGTERSVAEGNLRVAAQAAAQLKLYIDNNARILRSLGQELTGTNLAPWQQTRILRNHVLEFPEFRELSLFDAGGRPLATSRIGPPETSPVAAGRGQVIQGVRVTPIFHDDDLLPTTDLILPILAGDEGVASLVARLSLEELWRFVDQIRVGEEGYALVLSEQRQLVAHGNPDQKRRVAAASDPDEPSPAARLVGSMDETAASATGRYADDRRRDLLAAAARVPDLNWTVVVEQPTTEAFALLTSLQRQLQAAIWLALLGTVILGWTWSRSFITRILTLTQATRALAVGRMDTRVAIDGPEEMRHLGDAFNAMADRLVELQEDVRRQERQAMFGRIAAGLVHDLSHPIQNIGNSCKLIARMFDDLEYRETFRRTVDREIGILKRVLDDLRNLARPIPLERFPLDLNRSAGETVESMQAQAAEAGVTLRLEPSPEPAFIEGDVFAVDRVLRNLIVNAIQATARGGMVVVTTAVDDTQAIVRVRDTGCGIPPDRLGVIFEDFVTTKGRGLGLGLAISRKIVEQLGGRVTVTSEVGRGSTFVLEFARTHARPMLVAG
jgi:signal transduction histidine kinase